MKIPMSRRAFGLLIGSSAAPLLHEFAFAQHASPVPREARQRGSYVKIDSNENPLGPCAEAREAAAKAIENGGRYAWEETARLAQMIAQTEGIQTSEVRLAPGSSDPLFWSVCAFSSPEKSFVCGDPGYEGGFHAAELLGARVHKVPLTKTYAHDVRAMLKPDTNAGLYYICNPNNPTGTLTPRADIEYLIANKPKGSVLLLDEAYIHFSTAQMGSDLVRKGADVVVLRTFSKLYGMAGMRAGFAMGRSDLLNKLAPGSNRFMPGTSVAAAAASLESKNLIAERSRINREVREETMSWLDKHKWSFLASESNKFMMDARGPANRLRSSLAGEGVYVGRSWPIMPNHVRVTVGTHEEMKRFCDALAKVA